MVKLPRRATAAEARKAGATIAGFNAAAPLAVFAETAPHVAEIALGLTLRAYDFRDFHTPAPDWTPPNAAVTFHVARSRGGRGGLGAARRGRRRA